jgi:hypothetical protein
MEILSLKNILKIIEKILLNEFSLKNNFYNNKYLDIINNHNVVSICVRQNRFSERKNNKFNNKFYK